MLQRWDYSACTVRWPVVGDAVTFQDDEDIDDDAGWTLPAGARALVVQVDRDGNFRLQSPAGVISGWRSRKFYRYEDPGFAVGQRVQCRNSRLRKYLLSGTVESTWPLRVQP